MMKCKYCKNTINDGSLKCDKCGTWLNKNRSIHFGTTILTLLIALVSVVSISVRPVYDFYSENIKDKEIDLDLSVKSVDPLSMVLIIKNNGNADALIERAMVRAGNKYTNEKKEDKYKNHVYYTYLPTIDGLKDSVRVNFSNAIIPAKSYRIIRLERIGKDKKSNISKYYKAEDTWLQIDIGLEFINLETMKGSKRFKPSLIQYRNKKDSKKNNIGKVSAITFGLHLDYTRDSKGNLVKKKQ